MKSLVDFINEQRVHESAEPTQTSKDITFNFNGLDNAEDVVKNIQTLGTENSVPVSVDNQKVTVSFSKDTFDNAQPIIDALKEFIGVEGKSPKRASSEQYAQKLHAFEDAVKELDAFKEECETIQDPEPAVKDDDKKGDNKKDDDKK